MSIVVVDRQSAPAARVLDAEALRHRVQMLLEGHVVHGGVFVEELFGDESHMLATEALTHLDQPVHLAAHLVELHWGQPHTVSNNFAEVLLHDLPDAGPQGNHAVSEVKLCGGMLVPEADLQKVPHESGI